jgi:thioredoxin reductase
MYDAIIVGGGPAGLSAALILGRCLRKVLICDIGNPRNSCSTSLHGFLTRDGISPREFMITARNELKKYETIDYLHQEVTTAKMLGNGFEVRLANEQIFQSKKILLATGVVDVCPKINGFMELFGKSIFNCPYCDGWEVRNKKIIVYGKGQRGFKLAKNLTNWSHDVVLCTDGPSELSEKDKEVLKRNNVKINEQKIIRLEGKEGQLEQVVFINGETIDRDAMFFNTESFIRSRLLEQLGCNFSEEQGVQTKKYERTNVPGVFVAGNITREVQLVIVAAAEGAEAAFGINAELVEEETQ